MDNAANQGSYLRNESPKYQNRIPSADALSAQTQGMASCATSVRQVDKDIGEIVQPLHPEPTHRSVVAGIIIYCPERCS